MSEEGQRFHLEMVVWCASCAPEASLVHPKGDASSDRWHFTANSEQTSGKKAETPTHSAMEANRTRNVSKLFP